MANQAIPSTKLLMKIYVGISQSQKSLSTNLILLMSLNHFEMLRNKALFLLKTRLKFAEIDKFNLCVNHVISTSGPMIVDFDVGNWIFVFNCNPTDLKEGQITCKGYLNLKEMRLQNSLKVLQKIIPYSTPISTFDKLVEMT